MKSIFQSPKNVQQFYILLMYSQYIGTPAWSGTLSEVSHKQILANVWFHSFCQMKLNVSCFILKFSTHCVIECLNVVPPKSTFHGKDPQLVQQKAYIEIVNIFYAWRHVVCSCWWFSSKWLKFALICHKMPC